MAKSRSRHDRDLQITSCTSLRMLGHGVTAALRCFWFCWRLELNTRLTLQLWKQCSLREG